MSKSRAAAPIGSVIETRQERKIRGCQLRNGKPGKSLQQLSTGRLQKRYTFRPTTSLAVVAALLFLMLTVAAEGPALAAETPLSPEFLEYLGSVESVAGKGSEQLSLDEIWQTMKKLIQDAATSRKKDNNANGKDSEHGDPSKK